MHRFKRMEKDIHHEYAEKHTDKRRENPYFPYQKYEYSDEQYQSNIAPFDELLDVPTLRDIVCLRSVDKILIFRFEFFDD